MTKKYDDKNRIAIWRRVSKAGNTYYSGMCDYNDVTYSVMAFEDEENVGGLKLKAMPTAECTKCDTKWNTVEDSKGDDAKCRGCGATGKGWSKLQWDNDRQPKAKPYETLWGSLSPKEINGYPTITGSLTRKDWDNDCDIKVFDVVLFEVDSENEKAPTYSGGCNEPYVAPEGEGAPEPDSDDEFDF